MSQNFMGLGFSFFGKDEGLNKTLDGTTEKVDALTSAMSKVSNFGRDMDALSKNGRELMTSYEERMLQYTATGKQTAYTLGVSSDQIAKYTKQGIALTLSTGVAIQEATAATVEYARAKQGFNDLSIKSDAELAKASSILGKNSTQMREQIQMMGSVGIKTKEDMDSLTSAFLEAGRQAGNVGMGFDSLNSTLADLDKIYTRKTGKQLKSKDLVAYGKQAAEAAAAFRDLGYSGAEAMQAGTDMLKTQVGAQMDMVKLMTGEADAVPKMLEQWSISAGDTNKAFALMQEGPAGVLKAMAALKAQIMSKQGKGSLEDANKALTFIGAKLDSVYGVENSAKMVKFAMDAKDSTLKAMTAVEKATGGYAAAVKAYTDPRPLDVLMGLAEDGMVARFRAINEKSRDFLKDSQTAFKMWGDELVDLGKTKGPIGDITKKLAELDQKGYIGLLPKHLQGTANALGAISGRVGKIIEGLMSPLGLLQTGLMTFTVAVMDAFVKGPKDLEFLDRMELALISVGEDITNWLVMLPERIDSGLEEAFQYMAKLFDKNTQQSKLGKKMTGWWDKITASWTRSGPKIKKQLTDFWTGLVHPTFTSNSEKTAANSVGEWFRSVVDDSIAYVKSFGTNLINSFAKALDPNEKGAVEADSVGGAIGKWLGEVWVNNVEPKLNEWIGKARLWLQKFWKELAEGFSKPMAEPGSAAEGIGKWLGNVFRDATANAWNAIYDSFVTLFNKIGKFITKTALRAIPGVAIAEAFGLDDAIVNSSVGKKVTGFMNKGHKIVREQDLREREGEALERHGGASTNLDYGAVLAGDTNSGVLSSLLASSEEMRKLIAKQNKIMEDEKKNYTPGAASSSQPQMSTPKTGATPPLFSSKNG